MYFDEHNEGDYRIYAGALESPAGDGFMAAVVVNRLRGADRTPREAFRDERIAGGHRWASPEEALAYAVNRARQLIRTGAPCLAC